MSDKIRKLKEDAARLIARGKLDDACESYEKIVKSDRRDLTARQKLAELYARLGRKSEAVHEYQSVAGSYAADGLLLKAIAVCKIILQFDATHTETLNILAELSTKRRGGGIPSGQNVVEMPQSMSAALSKQAKKSAGQIRGASINKILGVATEARIRQQNLEQSNLSGALDPSSNAPRRAVPSINSIILPVAPAEQPRPPMSAAERNKVAAEMVPMVRASVVGPPPLPFSALISDDLPSDISFDDAEPIVVGNSLPEAPRSIGARILTAAIDAVTPTFEELVEMTSSSMAGAELHGSTAIADAANDASDAAATAAVLPATEGGQPRVSFGFAPPDGFTEAAGLIDLIDVIDVIDGTGPGSAGQTDLSEAAGHWVELDAAVDPAAGVPDDGAGLLLEDANDAADTAHATEVSDSVRRVDIDDVPPIPLFSDLPRNAFVALTEKMDLRVASAGETLIQEGDEARSMFVIIQGRVKVVCTTETSQLHLAELSDGAFFGEMALLSNAPRAASVIATEETMLFEISRETLTAMTNDYPAVGEVIQKFHKNRLITNLLKTSEIFQPFSTTDKKMLIEKFKSKEVAEGTLLITREKPGDGLYVVLSGRCDVLDNNAVGEGLVIASLKEGDVFGEMSMLWKKDTCASVRARTTCVVLRLPGQSFSELIMTHPQILEVLSTLSDKRQKKNEQRKAVTIVSDFLV